MDILLVEDDASLGEGLVTALETSNYQVHWCTNGEQALDAPLNHNFELAILDLGLPIVDGLDVLKNWRKNKITFPVLVLTARSSTTNKVTGLDIGADDYMTKPFDRTELLARVRSLLRRSTGLENNMIIIGVLKIHTADHTVSYNNDDIILSNHEYLLLEKLASHPSKIYSRSELEESISESNKEVQSNTVEVHIHNLRKKTDTNIIKTIRGTGYQLNTKTLMQ